MLCLKKNDGVIGVNRITFLVTVYGVDFDFIYVKETLNSVKVF